MNLIQISCLKNGELITKNQDIANTCNNHFGSTVEKLNLFEWNKQNGDLKSINIETTIQNVKSHPSCKIIKQHFKKQNTCSRRHVTVDEIKKVMDYLKNDKATGGEIPVKY